jgi:hypothetical protein
MKIKIKQFHGRPATVGFYPKSGVRLRPGEEYEFAAGEEALFEACLDTDFVEEVRAKRGRPKNEEKPGLE